MKSKGSYGEVNMDTIGLETAKSLEYWLVLRKQIL